MTWDELKPFVEIVVIVAGLFTSGKVAIWWEKRTNGDKVKQIQEKYDLILIELSAIKEEMTKCKESHTRVMDLLEATKHVAANSPDVANMIFDFLNREKNNL